MSTPMHMPTISQRALNRFGSLETTICAIRARRPLDLHAPRWRATHPHGTHAEWRAAARACLLDGLCVPADDAPLAPAVESVRRVDDLRVETLSYAVGCGERVQACLVRPDSAVAPLPGLLLCHAWGGPFLFGKERVVDCGRDHPLLARHRAECADGEFLAHVFARAGYVVLVADNFFFGSRMPLGIDGLPATLDPFEVDGAQAEQIQAKVGTLVYQGLKQLQWAGTSWAGVNLRDDTRALDYLASRPDVDARRIGCTGLSVGAWRTNLLAALDPRVHASVSVGWMTTGDYQQVYNVRGAVGPFCLLPGVWSRLDIPDVAVIGAPCASMVVLGTRDPLFPQEAKAESLRQIADGYAWAGCPERFEGFQPDAGHCYNHAVQDRAIAWFGRHLGGG